MRVSEWGRVVFEFHFLLREGEGQLYTYFDYRKKKSRKYPSLVLRIHCCRNSNKSVFYLTLWESCCR